MKRFVGLLAALTLLGAACTSPEVVAPTVPQPTVPQPTGENPGVHLAGDPEITPLSYYIQQRQVAWAKDFGHLWQDIMMDTLGISADTSQWTTDNMHICVPGCSEFYAGAVLLTFTDVVWDPENTTLVYGPVKKLDSVDKNYHGSGFLADLQDENEPLQINQTQTVTSEHTRETSFSTETRFDIASSQKVTIGGDNTGAKVEGEFSEAFGVTWDESEANTESTSVSVSKSIDYEFEPGDAWLLLLKTEATSYEGDMTVTGVPTWTVEVKWNTPLDYERSKWAPAVWGSHVTKCDGDPYAGLITCDFKVTIDEWQEAIEGVNTNFPGLHNYKPYDADTAGHVKNLWDPAKRQIVWNGKQTYTSDGVVDIAVTKVTGKDLDQIQRDNGLDDDQVHHGPVTTVSAGAPTEATGEGVACTAPSMVVLPDAIYVCSNGVILKHDVTGRVEEGFQPIVLDN